jgi:D-sedoheptulose 7-phosphate isomerase
MQTIVNYISDLKQTLEALPLDAIDQVITILHEARMRGRQIFIMGNGGSASTASHMVCDLAKNTRYQGWPNFKVIGLADNMAIFSAYANDEGYENVFRNQLESLLMPEDVVIGISASGNSPNVLNAIDLANGRGATTVAFTGFNGGRLSSMVNVDLHVPSDSIEQVEDIHLMLEHLITKVLREEVKHVSASGKLEELFPQSMHRLQLGIEELPTAGDIAIDGVANRARTSLDLFTTISRELAVELNLRDLLRRILRITLENMGATSGSILVLGESGRVVEGALVYNGVYQSHAPQHFAEVVERGLAGWVVENRQGALIPNTREDPRWLPRTWDQESEKPRSAISVPLLANDQVVGVLTLVNSQAGQFTDEDMSLLTAISTFVSLVNYAV